MKKLAAVFLLVVLAPALALGWLATRSLRDQEVLVHAQRTLLHQASTEALATEANLFLEEIRAFYGSLVEELASELGAEVLARDFDGQLRSRWSQAAAGAAVAGDGAWISPPLDTADPSQQRFLQRHRAFLIGGETLSELYFAPAPVAATRIAEAPAVPRKVLPAEDGIRSRAGLFSRAPTKTEPEVFSKDPPKADDLHATAPPLASAPAAPAAAPAAASGTTAPAMPSEAFAAEAVSPPPEFPPTLRNVTPLAQIDPEIGSRSSAMLNRVAEEALSENLARQAWSQLGHSAAPLREAMGERTEGAVSRLVEGELEILLWRREPAASGELVFWSQLDLGEIRTDLATLLRSSAARLGGSDEVCFALLDEAGEPVGRTVETFETDWRRPFVASELGAALPRWEVAAYLLDPAAVARSARAAQTALWMLVPLLLLAIGVGGVLILREIGREMRLARQKTDFVGNVSHELKTPLTSIRMFSELLAAEGELPQAKRRDYSDIVARESARLGRLIDQLLDFSRSERGERRYRRERLPLRDWLADTLAAPRQRLADEGFRFAFSPGEAETEALVIEGDRDALAQVLLNLLSNAEKYGGTAREIEVRLRPAGPRHAEIEVLDRGPGVPRAQAERIFEKFHRIDDSLDSGIEGSGLGLTIARQIVRAHGGELRCLPRPGGGARFVLRLPVLP